jgi:hypothetical protein
MSICIYKDYGATKLGLTLTVNLVFIFMIIKLGRKNIRSITGHDGGCYKKLNYPARRSYIHHLRCGCTRKNRIPLSRSIFHHSCRSSLHIYKSSDLLYFATAAKYNANKHLKASQLCNMPTAADSAWPMGPRPTIS